MRTPAQKAEAINNFLNRIEFRLPQPFRRWAYEYRRKSNAKAFPITCADLDALFRQTPETLAEWNCVLNSWEGPEGLPDPERSHPWLPGGRRCQIMRWIETAIGKRAILRHHNVVRRKAMTEEEFSDWWAANYMGDERAKYRSEKRDWERMRASEGITAEQNPAA